jgi:hypothetical protein
MTFIAVMGFAFTSDADVCTQTFTASGQDDDPTTVTIVPDDLTCTGGGTINSITLVNTADAFTSSNCGSWYDFTLIVDGTTIIANGCQTDFDGTSIDAGFSTIEVHSNDLDNYSDGVTITFDLEIDYTPASCPPPTSLTVSGITTTDATLSWVAGGSETDWNVEYGEAGFAQGTGTTVSATDTFVNVTGLTAATAYEFYVQADCGGDQSVWVGPYAFMTECDGVSILPFAENFENNFDKFMNADGNTTDFNIETTIVKEGTQSVHVSYTTNNNDSLIVKCPIDLSGNNNPKLSFWHIAKTEGGWDKCYVKISVDGGATYVDLPDSVYEGSGTYAGYFHEDSYSEWGTGTETPDNTWWKKEIFSLAAYNTATDVRILFVLTSDGSAQRDGWYIDDIQIENVACDAPSNLTVSGITTTDATLSWVAGGSETDWNVEYGESGFAQGTGTTVSATDTFVNVTGLTAGTNYEFYVQADCGGDQSVWVGPYAFMTSCETPNAISSFPWNVDFESGDICDFVITDSLNNGVAWYFAPMGDIPTGDFSGNNNSSATCLLADGSAGNGANTTMVTPELDLSSASAGAQYLLTFESQFQDYAGNGDAYVLVSTDGTTWTQVWSETDDEPTTGTMHELDLTSYVTGTSLYIAWNYQATAATAWQWAIDNISFEIITCPAPTSLTVSGITTTEATLSWLAGGTETNWNVEYGEAGFAQGTGTTVSATDTFVNVTGLTASTAYEFYVQADCGGGDASSWAGPYSFTTECEVITAFPWTETFENGGNAPLCWSQEYINGTHDWVYVDGDGTLTAYEGSYNAAFKHVSSGDISKLITPAFDLTSLSNPVISFVHAQREWGGDQDSLKLYYRTDASSAWVAIPGAVWTNDIQDWTLETISLPNPSSTYQTAFEAYDQYGHGVIVDSVVVREAPVIDLALLMPGNENYADCDFTGQDTIPFFVKNVGNEVIPANDTIFAWYELDGAAAVADTFVLSQDVNPSDTAMFQFAQTGNLAGYTTHNFKVYFNYNADINAANDTTEGTVTHYEPTVDLGGTNDTINVTSYPYTLDAGTGYDSYLWNDGSTNQTLDVNADGWYSVVVEDTNGCEATDSVYVLLNTGINSFNNINVSIYPNPNNGMFTLSAIFNTNVDFDVNIVDLNGKVVYSKHFEGVKYLNETIDIDSYAKGVYYVRIKNEKFVKQEKVVVR